MIEDFNQRRHETLQQLPPIPSLYIALDRDFLNDFTKKK